MFKPYTV